jgi:hypothetical protein
MLSNSSCTHSNQPSKETLPNTKETPSLKANDYDKNKLVYLLLCCTTFRLFYILHCCLMLQCLVMQSSISFSICTNSLSCLFGDNTYINTAFMATPYSGTKGGTRDAYNFYHSQLRINIKCMFGCFVQRWGILWTTMPQNMSLGLGKVPIIIIVHFCSRNVLCIIVRVDGVSIGEVRIV